MQRNNDFLKRNTQVREDGAFFSQILEINIEVLFFKTADEDVNKLGEYFLYTLLPKKKKCERGKNKSTRKSPKKQRLIAKAFLKHFQPIFFPARSGPASGGVDTDTVCHSRLL